MQEKKNKQKRRIKRNYRGEQKIRHIHNTTTLSPTLIST